MSLSWWEILLFILVVGIVLYVYVRIGSFGVFLSYFQAREWFTNNTNKRKKENENG